MFNSGNQNGDGCERNYNDYEELYVNSDSNDFIEGEVTGFDKIVGHIEDILVDCSFQHLQRDFLNKYWHLFEDGEENKLEYTAIFEEYVCTMENYIENYLKSLLPDFNLEDFLQQICERKNSLDGEVFEMLFSLSDFLTFKELMLDYRAVKEGKIADFSEDLLVTAIHVED